MEVLVGNKDAHHCRLLITTWPGICTFQAKLALCGRLEVMVRLVFFPLRTLLDIIQYLVYHCTLLQPLNTVLPPFLAEFSNQATLKSPGFENGNLDRPKPGMLYNSQHVLHRCADTSSRLGSFFCTPNQWPFLVVCWNQFIPQQGSYIQTFRVLIW